ncbi:hypothetical protein, partial [Candidatus Cardinium sp. cBcalN1]
MKKYLVVLPFIASCSGLEMDRSRQHMNGKQIGSKEDIDKEVMDKFLAECQKIIDKKENIVSAPKKVSTPKTVSPPKKIDSLEEFVMYSIKNNKNTEVNMILGSMKSRPVAYTVRMANIGCSKVLMQRLFDRNREKLFWYRAQKGHKPQLLDLDLSQDGYSINVLEVFVDFLVYYCHVTNNYLTMRVPFSLDPLSLGHLSSSCHPGIKPSSLGFYISKLIEHENKKFTCKEKEFSDKEYETSGGHDFVSKIEDMF